MCSCFGCEFPSFQGIKGGSERCGNIATDPNHSDRRRVDMAEKPLCLVDRRRKPANGTLPAWLRERAGWTGEDCLIWPFSRNPNGYPCQVRMDGEITYAHRHMCRLAHGDVPSPDADAAHSCGRGHEGCVHPGHLRWATRALNMQDAVGHGTTDRSHLSPLTEGDLAEIKRLNGALPQREIARRFGITQGAVSNIVRGKRRR